MDYADALLTIAEISVALTGFAGIVMAVLSSGHEKKLQDLWGLLYVLVSSALALVFSIVPFALAQLAMGETAAIRASSGALGLLTTGAIVFVCFGQLRTPPRLTILFWLFVGLGSVATLCLLLGGLDLVAPPFGLLVGLLWLLLVGFAQFAGFVVLSWTNAGETE
jgi:hypothetical protein